MTTYRIKRSAFILPGLIWAAGLLLIIYYAPKTVYLNGMVALGFLLLCAATFLALFVLAREYDKTDKPWPAIIDSLFPHFPVIEDKTDQMRQLTGFRQSYSDFLAGRQEDENSALQDFTTQLMWHSISLQKKRLMKHHLTMEMVSERRDYSRKGGFIRESKYFDGRYRVKDIYEEISALRTFRQGGKIIGQVRDKETAHYVLLSAKQTGAGRIICPNCGSTTTRENLINGCDYCGTRFSVEDMENKVDSFGLRRDFRTGISKRDAVKEVMMPWVTLITLLPLVYFSLIGAIVYMPGESILIRLIAGILAMVLLGLLAWCLKYIVLTLLLPVLLLISRLSERFDSHLIYDHKEEAAREKEMAARVRQEDPLFSIQSFFGGIQNKLAAIHYAEFPEEINAFSEGDLSSFLGAYKDVIDVDILKMTMDAYEADQALQRAAVSAKLRLLALKGNKIREREEAVRLTMVKDARCKTQAVCGPSVLKCSSCGASLSLMEGKTCAYCGTKMNLKLYDWVIEDYERV